MGKVSSIEASFLALGVIMGGFLGSCATSHEKPCTEGGQSPREPGVKFRGKKSCYQSKDPSGTYINDGKYFEWYPNEKIAVEGEYRMGKKSGRWIEYDEKGNKVSDKFFDEGKEIPRP